MSITLDSIDANFHSIKISDGTNDLLIDGSGHLSINDGGNSLTIDGTLTGITNDVNIADGGNSITVDAVDLDIRDLTHVSDSVKVGDGTDFLAINADGSINALTSPGGYDTWQTSTLSATTTAGEIAASPLSSRLAIMVQNLGTQDCFIGEDNTVTTSTGFKLPKGASFEMLMGENANLWAITSAGTADLRVSEFAA